MTKLRRLRVFLCHANQDKPIVRELYRRLSEEAWVSPWFDEMEILPGQDWEYEIEKALRKAHSIIVCLSKKSIKKESFIQKEIRIALDIADEKPSGTIFILPLRLDGCKMPYELLKRRLQYLDYSPNGEFYEKLLRALRERAKKIHVKADTTKSLDSHNLTNTDSAELIFFDTWLVELVLDLEPQYIVNGIQFILPRRLSLDEHSVQIRHLELPNRMAVVELPERAALDLELLIENKDPSLFGLLRVKEFRVINRSANSFFRTSIELSATTTAKNIAKLDGSQGDETFGLPLKG